MANAVNLNTFRLVVGLVKKGYADIPEDRMRHQPVPGVNPPVWILGHLVSTFNYVPKLLGGEPLCPPEYGKWFGPTSKLEEMPAALPTKAELLKHLSAVSETILVEFPKATDADLAKPNGLNFMPDALPTMRDVYENILHAHPMLHFGQLTVWRKLMKLPPVIVFPR